MRFGLHLTTAHPVDRAVHLARRAEELGFDEVTFHDALMLRPPWPTLAAFAAVTERVQLGPSVSNPFMQHPAVIAANAAHLDEISDGRGLVGLGPGSHFELVGLRPAARIAAVADAVHIVRRLCSGERGPWKGTVFSLGEQAALRFGPARAIPIHLGVYGPRSSRLAGRVADGIRPAGQWDPSFMMQIREWVREGAEIAGREADEIELVLQNWSWLHPDAAKVRADAKRILAQRLPDLAPMIAFYRIDESEVAAARSAQRGDLAALEAINDSTVDRFMAVGDASDLRAGLDRIVDAGFSSVSFSGALGPDPEAALELIGAEIARRKAELLW